MLAQMIYFSKEIYLNISELGEGMGEEVSEFCFVANKYF